MPSIICLEVVLFETPDVLVLGSFKVFTNVQITVTVWLFGDMQLHKEKADAPKFKRNNSFSPVFGEA